MARIPSLVGEFHRAAFLFDDVDRYGKPIARMNVAYAGFRNGRLEREYLRFRIEFAVLETDFRELSGFRVRERRDLGY